MKQEKSAFALMYGRKRGPYLFLSRQYGPIFLKKRPSQALVTLAVQRKESAHTGAYIRKVVDEVLAT